MDRHHRDPAVTFGNWCGFWLDPAFRGWSIEKLLLAVTAPALLIQGAQDEYGTLAQLDAIERGVSATTRRLVVPGGHSPQVECPGRVLAAIQPFLGDL